MDRKPDGSGRPVQQPRKADIWEGLSRQMDTKPLSVLSRCSRLQSNTGAARAEAKSRTVHIR